MPTSILMRIVALAALGLWLQGYPIGARAQSVQIQHLTVQDGLSQGSPRHLLLDSRRFLWLGTQDGLNRFDGHSFRVYRPEAGNPYALRGAHVAGIVEDSQGDLWVGTEAGLSRYDRLTDRFSLVLTLKGNRRVSPFYAAGDEVWLTAGGKETLIFDRKKRKLRRLGGKSFINRNVEAIDWTTRTSFGDVWLQNTWGIVRFDVARRRFHYYFMDAPHNEFGEKMRILSFRIDKENIAWLGTPRGLVRFDYRRKQSQLYAWTSEEQSLGSVLSLDEDHAGQLWIGTQRKGLWVFDKKKQTFREIHYRASSPEGLRNYAFYRIYADPSGIIWANSDPDGLIKIVPNAAMFGYLGRTLNDKSVRSLAEDRHGQIWLGTEAGIRVFDRRKSRLAVLHFAEKAGVVPTCLFRDSRQQMWAGTSGGLTRFDEQTQSVTVFSYPSKVEPRLSTRTLAELPDGSLILGTQRGLWRFEPDAGIFTRVPHLRDRQIVSCFIDSQNVLWVGCYFDRLYGFRVDESGGLRMYKQGLKGFTINAIREDTLHKILWVGTERGLVAYDRDQKKMRFYDEKNGLANSYICGIVPTPGGEVYVSSNHGLSSLDSRTGQVRNFDRSDGLQGYEFNPGAFLKSSVGECYFGGTNGLNYFYPNQFQRLSYNFRIHFFNFLVNEEPFADAPNIDETDLVYLRHDQNTFSLEFALIDYYSNGKNRYQYQLSGQDPTWVQAGDRTYVRYANLAPGRYIFKVKAANRDNVWGPPNTLVIIVRTPFWQSWWFTLLYLTLIGGGTYALARRRVKRLGEQQRERLKIALDAQEQERKNIAQDLHDEVGSRLATLKLYVSSLITYLKETPESRRLRQEIFALIQDSMVDIRRMLRELNPRTLEQYGYAAAVEELVSKINAAGQVHVLFESRKLPAHLPKPVETGLYRITQELLNNTLKHASASEVTLSAIATGDSLSFFYSDNGQGFQLEKENKGLGINNIESRVAVLGGTLAWYTAPGKGLEVTIELPKLVT